MSPNTWISKEVEKLVRMYHTNDPYELCDREAQIVERFRAGTAWMKMISYFVQRWEAIWNTEMLPACMKRIENGPIFQNYLSILRAIDNILRSRRISLEPPICKKSRTLDVFLPDGEKTERSSSLFRS